MKIIRSWDEFDKEIFSISEYPDEYRLGDKAGLEEYYHEYRSETLVHKATRIFIDGVHINFFNKNNREDFGYYVKTDAPYLQMHFEISGGAFYEAKEKGGMNCPIPSGYHTLFYFPALSGHLVYPAVKNGFSVEIEISMTYLKRVFGDNLDILEDFVREADRERPVMLGGRSFPVTPRIQLIITEMYHCPYSGQLKRIFMESKLMELLCLQIEQMTRPGIATSKSLPGLADREQMSQVKRLIEENISAPLSIEELARKAGMNRTKLQRNFKEVYGTTLFGYLTDLRMEMARDLLSRDNHAKVAHVAHKVGYKHPNHFSAAFRRKFGYSPGSIKSRME